MTEDANGVIPSSADRIAAFLARSREQRMEAIARLDVQRGTRSAAPMVTSQTRRSRHDIDGMIRKLERKWNRNERKLRKAACQSPEPKHDRRPHRQRRLASLPPREREALAALDALGVPDEQQSPAGLSLERERQWRARRLLRSLAYVDHRVYAARFLAWLVAGEVGPKPDPREDGVTFDIARHLWRVLRLTLRGRTDIVRMSSFRFFVPQMPAHDNPYQD